MFRRDGFKSSLWQVHSEAYTTRKIETFKHHYDVIIAGGGITGLSLGLRLQKAGRKVLIIEANTICFGTTGGSTAHINTLLDTPYDVIKKNFGEKAAVAVATAANDAIELIKNNIRTYNIDCDFAEAKAYLFAKDEHQEKELKSIAEGSIAAGLSLRYTNQIPVPFSFKKAIEAEGQAMFNPVKYVYGFARAFEEAGGSILENHRVTEVEEDEEKGVHVKAGSRKFETRHFVYATHIPPGVNILHMRCVPYRSYAMAVTLEDGQYPGDLTYDMEDPYHYYRTQIIEGTPYLIAGGEDHRTGDEADHRQHAESLKFHVGKHFRVKSIEAEWSSQYYESVDGLPFIGRMPGYNFVFVATGFGGNGITYSHVSAIVLEKMLEENIIYDNLFTPERIKPAAGFTSFMAHNATTVKELLKKLMPFPHIDALSELAHDDARLVNFEGTSLGLYKSQSGKLYAIHPQCTHMKCEVKWNSEEKSWDCPCHGARFDPRGKVLNAPAIFDLESEDISALLKEKGKKE
jgi:glycine/D-amino acid oxidase-like deaminating enzyme/nitrite reductase/ring-hydroxylating ferredoxin subunit